jgi:ubiquitin C-terminal hydrolase
MAQDAQFLFDHIFQVEPELLSGFRCPDCNRIDTTVTQTVLSHHLPKVVKLRIARDKVFDVERERRTKVQREISFPFRLAIQGVYYTLYAVQYHWGERHDGHYTADVFNLDNNVWFRCDDEHVSVLREGPESAFHCSHGHDSAQCTTRKMVAGSSDAYCLYYINEE